ncbi:hypothetical protein [Lacrimispora celerecrescens]|nr:hypothetical protein [Lacrimispora celerecrescens]
MEQKQLKVAAYQIYICELKERQIRIIFEKDNIDTMEAPVNF